MIAKTAYLTSLSPNVFVLNYQTEGDGITHVEISKAHLINILIDGASHAFREQYPHRVPAPPTLTESVNDERTDYRR